MGYGKAINEAYKQKKIVAKKVLYKEEQKIAIKFLCGSDLLRGMKTPNLWAADHLELILGEYGVVVVERDGDTVNDEFFDGFPQMFQQYKNNIHSFAPSVENTISSTKVRNLIKSKRSIKYLTPDSVIEYIAKQKLYQ